MPLAIWYIFLALVRIVGPFIAKQIICRRYGLCW
jgi:hypothetical protein